MTPDELRKKAEDRVKNLSPYDRELGIRLFLAGAAAREGEIMLLCKSYQSIEAENETLCAQLADAKACIAEIMAALSALGGMFEHPENVLAGYPDYIGLEKGDRLRKALTAARPLLSRLGITGGNEG